MSHVTQGMFKRGRELEVVPERQNGSDSEESEREEQPPTQVAQIIKQSVKDYVVGSSGGDPPMQTFTDTTIENQSLQNSRKQKIAHARQYSMSEEKQLPPIRSAPRQPASVGVKSPHGHQPHISAFS